MTVQTQTLRTLNYSEVFRGHYKSENQSLKFASLALIIWTSETVNNRVNFFSSSNPSLHHLHPIQGLRGLPDLFVISVMNC